MHRKDDAWDDESSKQTESIVESGDGGTEERKAVSSMTIGQKNTYTVSVGLEGVRESWWKGTRES